jgi:TonB family protein
VRFGTAFLAASFFTLAFSGGAVSAGESQPKAQVAQKLLAAGREAVGLSDYGQADQAFRGALAACRAEGDEGCIWQALSSLASVDRVLGRLEEAKGFAEEAAVVAQRMKDHRAQGESYRLLALVLAEVGQIEEAEAAASRAMAVAEELERPGLVAEALAARGELEITRGFAEDACRTFEEALAGAEEAGLDHLRVRVRARLGLGRCLLARGDFGQAEAAFKEVFSEAVRLGDKLLVAKAMHETGRLEALRGDTKRAEELLLEARVKFRSLGAATYAEGTASYLGRLRAEAGLPTEDERAKRAAEATRRGLESLEAGDFEAAVRELKLSASLAPYDPESRLALARAYRALGQDGPAEKEELYASAVSGNSSPFDLTSQNPRYLDYFSRARRQLDRVYVVPQEVSRGEVEGFVRVAFTLERSGRLADASVEESSGPPVLDQAALTTLRLAEPFGPFPDGVGQDLVTIVARFVYDRDLAEGPSGLRGEGER